MNKNKIKWASGIYEWVQKGTAGPWLRYALYWVPLLWIIDNLYDIFFKYKKKGKGYVFVMFFFQILYKGDYKKAKYRYLQGFCQCLNDLDPLTVWVGPFILKSENL